MDGVLALDADGFLKSAKQLERRFNVVMNRDGDAPPESHRQTGAGPRVGRPGPGPGAADGPGLRRSCKRKTRESPSTRLMSAASGRLVGSAVDKRLFVLSGGIYGGSAWSAMFCAAAAIRREPVTDACLTFLHDSVAAVAGNGLNAWICDLVDDARQAAFTGVPSPRTPLLIRSMGAAKLIRQSMVDCSARYGDRKLRSEIIGEHCEQTHRFAAYSLLQWGGNRLDNGVAFMLLTRPDLGAALLREMRASGRGNGMQDAAARRMAGYLAGLQDQADRQYAWMRERDRAFGLHPDDVDMLERRAVRHRDGESGGEPETLLEMDRRYLFDALHVVAAYRGLWNLPKNGDAGLASIGCGATDLPRDSLWRNPIYLRMVAETLMGAASAADLTNGFAERDCERFEYGVAKLERIVAIVRSAGLAAAPTMLAPSVSPNFGELRRLPFSARDRRLRAHARVEADMATVMLAHLPDPAVARRAGAALIRGDLTAYSAVIARWRSHLR